MTKVQTYFQSIIPRFYCYVCEEQWNYVILKIEITEKQIMSLRLVHR
jgi:hypothetical protein